jgi:glutathione peroxidase-family protein
MEKITQNEFLNRMKTARENINKFATLPYGTYFCLLEKVINRPSKEGKEMVQFVYKVLEGDHRGAEHRYFYHIWHEVAFNILVQDLENLGYPTEEIKSMEDLNNLFEQIVLDRLHVNIRIYENQKNPQYPTTRIEEVVESTGAVDSGSASNQTVATAVTAKPAIATAKPTAEKPATVSEEAIEAEAEVETAVEVEMEDAPAPAEKEEEAFVDVGSRIRFTFKGEEKTGKIQACAEDGSKVTVVSGGRRLEVKTENILEILK